MNRKNIVAGIIVGLSILVSVGLCLSAAKIDNRVTLDELEGTDNGQYLYIYTVPPSVESGEKFDIHVEVWNFGTCSEEGCSCSECVHKKEGTQSWHKEGWQYKQEKICDKVQKHASRNKTFKGKAKLSPLYGNGVKGGLYKRKWYGPKWDGTVKLEFDKENGGSKRCSRGCELRKVR